MTELERLQKNVADTKANYDAAAKVVDAAFAFLDAAAADPAYYLADVAAHNAWDAADTKYAAWAKARLALIFFLKEQDNVLAN